MLGARFIEVGMPLQLARVQMPVPLQGRLLVKVKACGICGSDLTILKGALPVPPNLILGHEVAGEVAALGEGVTGWKEGERVALFYASGCNECSMCQKGWVVGCVRTSRRLGVNEDGGFAHFVSTPATSAVRIPKNIDFAMGALATDAVATSIHALCDNGRIRKGETIVIFGVGGLAVPAIQIARLVGAKVIAVSRSAAKLDLARGLGAEAVIKGGDSTAVVKAIHKETAGQGVNLALQLVPNPAVDRQAIACTAPGGRIILVGFTPATFTVNSLEIIIRQLTIIGSRGMTLDNIRQAIDLVSQRKVDLSPLLTTKYRLAHINQALNDFTNRKVVRPIIEP